ncbi:hypothetical protein STEG23_009992, partial [Scotinomys teguina]
MGSVRLIRTNAQWFASPRTSEQQAEPTVNSRDGGDHMQELLTAWRIPDQITKAYLPLECAAQCFHAIAQSEHDIVDAQ